MIYAKLGALLALLAAVGWGAYADYHAGKKAGQDAIQTQFDQFKIDSAKAAATALAAVTKERDDAIANNEAVTNDLQAQLSATRSNANDMAASVRDYQARLSASTDALRQATDQQRTAAASGIAASKARFDELSKGYDAACQRDAIRLNKLTAEIKPQL